LREEKLIKLNQKLKDIYFYKPKPSKKECSEGYKGRVGIFEVLPVTESIKNLITEKGTTTNKVANQAIKEGMRTMVEDGLVKAAKGVPLLKKVLRVIKE